MQIKFASWILIGSYILWCNKIKKFNRNRKRSRNRELNQGSFKNKNLMNMLIEFAYWFLIGCSILWCDKTKQSFWICLFPFAAVPVWMPSSVRRWRWTRTRCPTSRRRSSACLLRQLPHQRAETRPVRPISCRATLSAYQLYRPTLRGINLVFIIFPSFIQRTDAGGAGDWKGKREWESERESTLSHRRNQWDETNENEVMIRTLYFSSSSLCLDTRAAWAHSAEYEGFPVFSQQIYEGP